jgi:ASC-1-like (ASCH) protein
MHINAASFEKILSWEKTMEVRLNDEKRKVLKVDDVIEFENDDGEVIPCKIEKLSYFDSFANLYAAKENVAKAGHTTAQQAIDAAYSYYTPEQEKELGVVAIDIEGV